MSDKGLGDLDGRGENLLGFSAAASTGTLNHYRDAKKSGGKVTAKPEPFAVFGTDLFGQPLATSTGKKAAPLAARFTIPALSVLNARDGEWQERKRAWTSVGIDGELPIGRDDALTHNTEDWFLKHGKTGGGNATSIFDPVLCELAYTWFAPPAGHVLDPFAGGSVRGIVAALLGRSYTGIDLRHEQTAANEVQAERITPGNRPRWLTGDSAKMLRPLVADAVQIAPADFVFSCPPYGDLEKYSDDPRDLSAMDHGGFVEAYREIIGGACARLKPDRFACFVVGDFRDKRGEYRDFVSTTIAAFKEAGLALYNEAILVTSVGSLPIRVGKQFDASRKLGKTHQNVLVFVKGDGKRAAQAVAA